MRDKCRTSCFPRALLLALSVTAFPAVFAQDSGNPTINCAEANYSHDIYVDTAHDDDGKSIPYVLTPSRLLPPRYALIVMPGSTGQVNPTLTSGQLTFQGKCNFLVRSRILFADDETEVITTDADLNVDRMRAIVRDIRNRNPLVSIFIAGTSRSTNVTMRLAEKMDGEVDGFIHTSSMAKIADLDTRGLKSRNLIVTHANDTCRVTPPSASVSNHQKFGTDLLVFEGGSSEGNPCQPFGHHGFYGVEHLVTDKIISWIRK